MVVDDFTVEKISVTCVDLLEIESSKKTPNASSISSFENTGLSLT